MHFVVGISDRYAFGDWLDVSFGRKDSERGRVTHIARISRTPADSPDADMPPQINWEPLEEAAVTAPTMRIPHELARALYEELGRFYHGASDSVQLRADYDAERKRVNELITTISMNLTNLTADTPR